MWKVSLFRKPPSHPLFLVKGEWNVLDPVGSFQIQSFQKKASSQGQRGTP